MVPTSQNTQRGTCIGRPVPDFPIEFEWQTGDWVELFDRQTALVKEDLKRAYVEGRAIVYMSCPISSAGGGHYATNVDIAGSVERNLMAKLGERFFILNPSRYQLETKEGVGLIYRHAEAIRLETGRTIELEKLMKNSPPGGGDYMRMWTKVMVEDDYREGTNNTLPNMGNLLDMVYFVGPSDVQEFFLGASHSLSQAVETYFARKYSLDVDFKRDFDCLEPLGVCRLFNLDIPAEKDIWLQRRQDFFKYYAIKAGTNFSLGSHDEWNIVTLLNERRRSHPDVYGIGGQIAMFFDGRQVNPGGHSLPTAPGYEVRRG